MRSFLAVIAGMLTAFAVVAGVEMLGHTVYPVPADLDPADPESLKAFVAGLPAGAFAFVLAAWILGTWIGGTVAGLIARSRSGRPSLIVGCLVLAATVSNLAVIPHPTWVAAAGLGGIVLATALAVRRARAAARP